MRHALALIFVLFTAPAIAADMVIGPPPAHQTPLPEVGEATQPADLLPQSRVAHGRGPIRRAWLSTPTDRYAHGVLGDDLEASSLVLETVEGARRRLDLPAGMVFEDLIPRIIDLDGDGRDEAVLVVRSDLEVGAAPAVVVLRDDKVGVVAGPPLGRANRWLNPVGVADLDGDGRPEVAVVETPHIGGTLKVYRWQAGGLTPVASLDGFSNHAIGSAVLTLHAVTDLTGDGRPELLVPGADRRSLKLVRLEGDRLTVLQTWDLPSPVVGPVSVTADKGVIVPLADGSQARVIR